MRGLFLRLYGALGLLFVLGLLLVVSLHRPPEHDPWAGPLSELSDFPREAAALEQAVGADQEQVLAQLEAISGYPVALLPRAAAEASLGAADRNDLGRGEAAVTFDPEGARVFVPLATQPFVVVLGPVAPSPLRPARARSRWPSRWRAWRWRCGCC